MKSLQKACLSALAARLNAGDTDGLEAYFTADFRLHDPGAPAWPVGVDGVRRMVASFGALGDGLRLDILDMVEEGDKVAVRWGVSWSGEGKRNQASIVAIYRFIDGRIAEDWGVTTRAPWPTSRT